MSVAAELGARVQEVPVQQSMDVEMKPVTHLVEADAEHDKLPNIMDISQTDVHSTFPKDDDSVCYCKCLWNHYSITSTEIIGDTACGRYGWMCCFKGHRVVGLKGDSPWIREDNASVIISPELVCLSSDKFLCCKNGLKCDKEEKSCVNPLCKFGSNKIC
jgi:hypothetical protein